MVNKMKKSTFKVGDIVKVIDKYNIRFYGTGNFRVEHIETDSTDQLIFASDNKGRFIKGLYGYRFAKAYGEEEYLEAINGGQND